MLPTFTVNRAVAEGAIASSLVIIRANEQIDLRYLVQFLRSKLCSFEIAKYENGAAQPNLSARDLKLFQIPLPPLLEQKRIAAILDKADQLRQKRQQAIGLADEFLRSVFLDMFGDPVTNPKGWEVTELSNFCSKVVDCPHSTPEYSDKKTDFPCLRSSDLQNGKIDLSSAKYVDEPVYLERIARLKPEYGDLVFCREGARLGNLAMVPENCTPCLGQRTMLLRPNLDISTSEFMLALLVSKGIQDKIWHGVLGAAAPRINIKDLMRMKFILPPVVLQSEFSDICLKYYAQHKLNLRSASEIQTMSGSLSQKAFAGEL